MNLDQLPKPPSGPAPGQPAPLFAFHMRVVEQDPEGYYFVRWDRATPIIIHATDRGSAFEKCWAVMGKSPRGWNWTAKIDRITEVGDDR